MARRMAEAARQSTQVESLPSPEISNICEDNENDSASLLDNAYSAHVEEPMEEENSNTGRRTQVKKKDNTEKKTGTRGKSSTVKKNKVVKESNADKENKTTKKSDAEKKNKTTKASDTEKKPRAQRKRKIDE
uniref:Uncharacterized protein n=1 Tax=Strongyloides stercoralis TaxID=6248 RepID=A0A0K0ES67_STRER